jgi:hypothetical protein
MSPKYSPDTHQVLTRSPKGKTKGTPETPETTTTTTQEAIFFGVFVFTKANGKSLRRTEQNMEKSRPRKQKKEQQRKEEEANQPRGTQRTPNADRQLQKKHIPWMRSSTSTA